MVVDERMMNGAGKLKLETEMPAAGERGRLAAEEKLLISAFADIRPLPMGISLGLVSGAGLFLATAILLVRAALFPQPGQPVGPMLGLLGNIFPGYTVTWPGSGLGFVYGFLTGFFIGTVMASLVNLNHRIYLRRRQRRARVRAPR